MKKSDPFSCSIWGKLKTLKKRLLVDIYVAQMKFTRKAPFFNIQLKLRRSEEYKQNCDEAFSKYNSKKMNNFKVSSARSYAGSSGGWRLERKEGSECSGSQGWRGPGLRRTGRAIVVGISGPATTGLSHRLANLQIRA